MAKPRTKTSKRFPGIGPVTEKRLIEVGILDLAALRKLGAVNKTHAIAKAIRFGMLP